MTRRAWAYIIFIYLAGAILILEAFLRFDSGVGDWQLFLVLTVLACLAQLFGGGMIRHQAYQPGLVFFFAGALTLQPAGFVLMVIVAHTVEWGMAIWRRGERLRAPYIQPFNICMHVILGALARTVYLQVNPGNPSYESSAALVGALLAALVYALFNHLIVGQVLVLARDVRWKHSRILSFENMATDYAMLVMGYGLVVLESRSVWLILPILISLYLVTRALRIPGLRQLVNMDAKTGLWNAKFFLNALEVELSRSRRYNRRLTVVMADLDYLRNINNAYGHIGGDAVLVGVAAILKARFRDYDVVARFGGEEFAILMPETSPQEAFPRVETVRQSVAEAEFVSPATQAAIKATMSFGLAGINDDTLSARQLIHCADMAAYQAKVEGRNRTRVFTPDMAEFMGIEKLGDIEINGM